MINPDKSRKILINPEKIPINHDKSGFIMINQDCKKRQQISICRLLNKANCKSNPNY